MFYFLFVERIIQGERVILYVFSNTIYFEFWLVNFYLRICA